MTDYPSVTQVLRPHMDFSKISPEVLAAACERGTEVHGACAAYAKKLWFPDISDGAQGFHQSFVRWFDAYVVKVHIIEEQITHEQFGYHGTMDLLITIKGDRGPSLWDLKTGAVALPWWPLQVAAYDSLARVKGHAPCRRGSIRLSKEGKMPKLKEYNSGYLADDFRIFLSALNVWRYFNG